jgi:hypothetical protein
LDNTKGLRAHGALLALLVAAAFTRFYQLGVESFWLDETITFVRSRMAVPKLIDDSFSHFHNPAYFLLMHAWMGLGDGEAIMRAPSAIAGVLKVLAVYVAGSIAVDKRVGLLSGLFVTLCPVQLHYDQEARMYAPLSLGAAVALCGMLWMVRNPDAAWVPLWKADAPHDAKRTHAIGAWLAFVLGCVFALYMHNTAVLFVTGCSLAVLPALLARAQGWKRLLAAWTVANLVVVGAFAVWLPKLLTQSDKLASRGYSAIKSGHVIAALRDTYVFGVRSTLLSIVVAIVVGAGIWSLRKQPFVLSAIGILALSAGVLFGVASLHEPMFSSRLLSWGALPMCLLGGAGLAALSAPNVERRFARHGDKLIIPAFVALCVFVLHTEYYERPVKPRWREVLTEVSGVMQGESAKSSHAILLAVSSSYITRYYFGRKHEPIPRFRVEKKPRGLVKRLQESSRKPTTLWVMRASRMMKSDERVVAELERGARVLEKRDYPPGVEIIRYEVAPAPRP